MKKISNREISEFIYSSEEERATHITQMEQEGWLVDSPKFKLKDHVSVFSAKQDDYEWYAKFRRMYTAD